MLNIEYKEPIRNQLTINGLESVNSRYNWNEISESWVISPLDFRVATILKLNNVNRSIKTSKEAIKNLKENRHNLIKGSLFIFRGDNENDLYITI